MPQSARAEIRDRFLLSIRQRPVLMGILNVTPDSFSDGGRHFTLQAAMRQAEAMVAEGCAIVDLGGESTRPGAAPVSAEEEWRRVAPVLEQLRERLATPLSIDTTKASVARKAAQLGAIVINDVWGLQADPAMADVVAETGSALVIMHNRDSIDAGLDIFDDFRRFFDRSLGLAERAGIPRNHILLDPGIGFGKTLGQNLASIWQLDRLAEYGLPILLGLSRKSFIGKVLDAPVEGRLTGTIASNLVGLMRGAAVLRVHDVAENGQALRMFLALKGQSHD